MQTYDKPVIAITNDDGIAAKGISILAEAVAGLARVVIVAPDRERSASSHAITLASPLRVHQRDTDTYAIDGLPTDCTYLAVHKLCGKKPDLVLSGINHGANLGNDVTYSGTVGGAMEAACFDIPAIAFSQHDWSHVTDWTPRASFARTMCQWALAHKDLFPLRTVLNVNFPVKMDPANYAWTKLGRRRYEEIVTESTDPRGGRYYWIGGGHIGFDTEPGTDCEAILRHVVSISPVTVAPTATDVLSAFAQTKFN